MNGLRIQSKGGKVGLWKGGELTMFKGKKAIVIGERDGVQGPAIAQCLLAAGAEVVYVTTECFV